MYAKKERKESRFLQATVFNEQLINTGNRTNGVQNTHHPLYLRSLVAYCMQELECLRLTLLASFRGNLSKQRQHSNNLFTVEEV